jgi:DNA polymerase-3 subunit delta
MYKNEFDKNIKNGFFYKSIMFYGEENFFIKSYTEKIINILAITNDEKLTVYQDEYSLELCINYLSQSSLFGDRNLLILKIDSTKIDKRQIEQIVNITIKNENSYFILQFLDINFKIYVPVFSKKEQLNIVNHLRFFKPTIVDAINILADKAYFLKINIDKSDLRYIYEYQNMNLLFAINDLNKLAIFDEKIDIKMINDILFNLSHITKESLVDKILSKKNFSEDLQKFLEDSTDEESIKLLSFLINYITILLEFNIFLKVHNFADSKAILGYKPPSFIEQKYISQSMKFSLNNFEDILNYLLEMELYIKSGIKIDKNSFIYSGLMKMILLNNT